MLRFIFALFVGFSLGSAVEAAPRNGRVVEGAGSISQSGTHTDIRQNSDFLATSWGSFNIAAHESVQAHQPNSTSRLLIRVDGGGATNIAGTFTANGITILENRNGVQFSRGAIVNVGGLLATSSRISGVAGANWQLNGTGGAVVNHGQIVAGAGGAILAAVKVQNTGDITAKGGDVALGAGSSFTVDFAGSMVGFEITKAASGASITNSGKIEAQGGVVSLSAQEAQAVRTNVVSVGGVVKATRLERRGGVVYLSGGTQGIAEVSGDVSASRKVQTTGEYVVVKEGALLKAPEILVGGDFQGKGDVPTSRRTLVERGALLNAGKDGRVIVWSDETTWFNGDISAPGGFAEVSGKKTLASVNLAGIDVGDLLLDPADIIIVSFGITTPLEPSPNGDIAADASEGTLTLRAADIDAYEGDLSLAASNTITVNRLITKPTGGLTLDAGGVLTISADITMSAGNLTLTGSAVSLTGNLRNIGNNITITADTGDITITGDITATGAGDIALTGANIVLGSALTSLTGDEISLTGAINESTDNDSLTIDVRGRLTLNSGINLGTGTLAINARERINLANANTVITAGTFTIKFTDINGVGDAAAGFTIGSTATLGNLAATSTMPTYTFAAGNPVDCVINTGACILTTTGNANLATADAALASDVSITIDIGTGALTFGGSAMLITITSPEVTITAGAIDLGGRSLTITSNGAALELNLNADITTTGTINIGALDKTLTLKSTEDELTLAATDISLLSNNNIRFAQSLDLAASGLLTLNSGLNARGLTLGATTGAGRRIRLIPSASGFFTISLSSGTLTINSEITNIVARQPNEIFPTSVSFQTGGGTLVLNADINIAAYTGSGDSTHSFSFGGSFSVSRLLILGGNRTVKTFGNLNYAFNVLDESAILNTETGQGGNDNFTLQAGGTLAFRGDSTNVSTDRTDINLGTGELILTGTDVRNPDDGTLMTQGISLNILNFRLTGKAVTFNGTVATVDRGRATDIQTFAITARGGNITLNGGINLFSFRLDQLDGSITLDSDTAIVLGRDVTLAADRVFLTGAIGERATPRALTIMTRTSITLNSDIDLGSGNLTLTSGSTLVLADGVTLAGGAVSLTGEIFLGFADPSFTITAMGVLTLNDNIDVGDGALTLTGGTGGIVLGGDITLIGGAVSLTGAINESTARADDQTGKGGRDSLTITASGVLTLGSSINLGTSASATGTGTLTITAERISAARITLTAASPISIEFTGANLISPAQGFTVDNVATLGMVTFMPSVAYMPLPPLSCPVTGDCMLGDGMTALILPAMLTAAADLTLDAGSSADITFAGTEPIVISAQTITITARRLLITGNRPLTITAATGALTVNANIRTDMVSAITLTASSGVLTLGGNISRTGSNMPAGNISLTGVDMRDSDGVLTRAGIVLSETLTLNGAAISLSGSIDEPDDSNDALNITARGIITLNNDIRLGAGNLTLNSTNSITLGSALTLTGAAINLTGLIAGTNDFTVDASGTLTLNADIDIGAMAALSLTAGVGAINGTIGGNTDMLTAGTVSLTQAAAFPATEPFTFGAATSSLSLTTAASQTVHGWMTLGDYALSLTTTGAIIINADIATGTSNLTLNGNMGIMLGANGITLTGGAIALTGAINASSNNYNFTITAMGGIAINTNINLGAGSLALTAGMGAGSGDISSGAAMPRRLTASTVSFTQSGAFGDTALFAFMTPTLNLTTAASQTVHGWMFAVDGRNLSVRSTGGMITINADIATGSGNLTLNGNMGIVLAVGNMRRLSGAAVSLTGAITSGSHNLTVTATGQLTLNSNIALTGSGAVLTLTAGTGDIVDGTGTPTLTASTVSLMQASAFGGTALFMFAADTLNLETAAPQMVHEWMIPDGRNLSLTSTGGAITIGRDIALGAGSLALNGGTLVFSGAARTLSGANITLTGDADSAVALSLTATGTGTLTLNSSIATTGDTSNLAITGGTGGITTAAGIALTSGSDLTTSGDITAATGNGNLTLSATGTITLGGSINLGTGTAALSAGSATGLAGTSVITAMAINISFSNMAITRLADVDALDDTGGNTPTITFANSVMPTYTFGARGCGDAANACVIDGAAQLFVEPNLMSNVSITIDATTGAGSSVRFDGTSTITLTAPLVTIIAETINLGGRMLRLVNASGAVMVTINGSITGAGVIDATGGTLSLVGAPEISGDTISITADLLQTVDAMGDPASGDLGIIATDGLTIATGINIGTGTTLTLTAGPGDITGTGTPMLTADTVSFTQDGTFGDTALFTFAASVGALNLTTAAGQRVESWMFAVMDRDLSVTSPGRLLILGDINIRAGDLTLSGMRIELDQNTNAITLTAGAVSLTGNVDGSLNTIDFTIMAGGILTLNNNINGTGDIMLTGTSIVLGDGARILNGGAVTLTGAVSATNTPLTITATGDITINNNINLGSGALILTATGANIVDAPGVVPVLTASTVSLTQAGTFADGLFTVASAASLTLDAGSAPQVVHAWMAGGTNRALSLTTTGAITIGRDIATGTSSLTLDGGTLTLTAAATLSGADIALTGALTSVGLALIITATGDITINDNISLGAGALTLTAGMGGAGNITGNGDITDGGRPTLTATTVSLRQDNIFGNQLFTFAGISLLNLSQDDFDSQNYQPWMRVGAGTSLSLTATGGGDIILLATLDFGSDNLTLSSSSIVLAITTNMISGGAVSLTGSIVAPSNGLTLTITATAALTLNNNISLTGTGTALTLTAGTSGAGNILSDIDTGETLTAGTVSLTQAGAFAPTALFTFDASVGTLNLTTAAPQTVHPWMVAADSTLNLTSTGGSITVGTAITASGNITLTATTININADIGTSSTPITGSLTLNSDTLAFSGARTLSGANISLTGAATNAADLTITTAGTLTIAASIAITGGDLMLTGTSGIVIGTATGAGAFALSGDAITLAGAVTTASTDGIDNFTDFTITARGALTVAGIDLSNNDASAHGALVLTAGAGRINFGDGSTLNAASVTLTQVMDFTSTRPVDILIEGNDPGLINNPVDIVISGDTQVPWAAILTRQGPFTITDGGVNDPDGMPDNGIVLNRARLAYTENLTINAGARDITFVSGLGNITWEAPTITITARSIMLGGRTLTITAEGGTLTLNVTSIIATGTNDLAFAGTTIRLGRTAPGSDTGTATLTGAAITLTAANGITVGRFNNSGAFISTGAPILVVNASGVLTLAADITSVARIILGTAADTDGITVTGARTLSGSLIRFNSGVTATDGLTVNSTGNLIFNGDITTGTSALSLTSATIIRILGDANATRTLTGGDITLTAANGVEATASQSNLTVTASGVLTIAAGITTPNTLTLQGAGAIVTTGRPRLTASTVSFTQNAAFAAIRPFRFGAVSSLVFATDAAQDVHTWMIVPNSDLTITSPARVRVAIAIGANVPGRDLGDGSITLTSTGANIRIQENISTTGNIILSGVTDGINFNNGAAKTLSGADITLTGEVVSNRGLGFWAITATGVLTLNNNITVTASDLVLWGFGEIDLVSALTLTGGGDVTLTGVISENANSLTITAAGTLTINSDSITTGSGDLSLTGAAIRLGRTAPGSATGTATLTGAAITLTAANGITVGRFNNSGAFISTGAPALMVTASGVLTIAANITSVANIALNAGTGGIVIGTATGSPALIWSGDAITLAGDVTTASSAGAANSTDLTITAQGALTVAGIDLSNSDDSAYGDLVLSTGADTLNFVGSPALNATSVTLTQVMDFTSTRPVTIQIEGTDPGLTGNPATVVISGVTPVLWAAPLVAQGSFTITDGGADDPDGAPDNGIELDTARLAYTGDITINAGAMDITFASGVGDTITWEAENITIIAGSINTNDRNLTITTDGGTLTLISNIATGTGNLTLTSGTIQIGRAQSEDAGTVRTLSGVNITLTAADGIELGRLNRGGTFLIRDAVANLTVTATGMLGIAADITVDSTATSGGNITLTGDSVTFGAAARTISGADITLNGAATGTDSLTITASSALTLSNNITLTGMTSILALRSGQGAITGMGTLFATTIVRLRQVDEFAAAPPFNFGNDIGSLEFTTTVNQDVHDWMINDGTDLTVESTRRVRVSAEILASGDGARDIGTGDLTLRSGTVVRIVANITTGGAITLSGGTGGINLDDTDPPIGTAVTLTGAAITLSGNALSNRALTLNASSGILRINNNITLTGTSNLTLMSATVVRIFADISTDGDITLSGGGTIGINLNSGAGAKTFSGAAITLTGDALSNQDLTLTATGILTLNDDIIATSTSALSLSGSSVALGGALTLTGGDITLTGAATGGANLTITASGTLTINNDINIGAGALTLRGAGAIVGPGRPRLTAGTVSLRQDAAFGARPFGFTAGSLALTTEAAQDVHNWMIVANRNLTVTSSDRVRVLAAIGSGVDGRNLGTGSLTLTSTGGAVRIFENISTDGNITLSGATGGINFNNRAAKTLSGGTITLTGTARSNRDLALNATSGALTLNGDINTGTSALTLTGATISIAGDSSATHTLSGGAITLTGAAAGTASLTITASGTLTINNSITLTGADLTLALSGAGAIVGMNTPALTASTVSLRQAAAFAEGVLFTFGSATDSLEFTTTVNQDVHDWMINDGTDLTVESPGRVRVLAEIVASGDGVRDIGTGDLTLRSGALVRIVANITTTGDITLSGGTRGINLNDTIPPTGTVTLTGAAITLSGNALSNRALTLDATSGILRINNNITLTGTSSLTLMSATVVRIFADISTGGDITLSGGTIGINFNNRGAKTLSGRAITLTGAAVSNRDLTLIASGTLMLNSNIIATGTSALSLSGSSVTLGGALTLTGGDITLTGAATGSANLTLDASGILTINNDITLTGAGLTLALSGGGAIGDGGTDTALTASTVSLRQVAAFAEDARFTFGSATGSLEFTTTVNQDVHNWMIRENTNLTVTSSNRVRVLAAIGMDEQGRNLGTGVLTLTSTGRIVRIVADISTTGDVTLTASGTLTISNDITLTGDGLTLTLSGAGAISNGGNGGANRPALTASTVSFTQDAAFATTGPFRFGSATGSLEFTTTVNQDVHNWMIRENTNLTVTSSNRVRVLAAIGSGVTGRDLGTGSLTLTSTGRIVRIVADISTTGDATITASSILTINNNINIGTGALTLEATSFDFGSSVELAAGSHSFTPILTCNTGTSPSCTVNTP